MDPMEPLDGDTFFTITTQIEWIIWNFNGDNNTNGNKEHFKPILEQEIVIPLQCNYYNGITIVIPLHRYYYSDITVLIFLKN